MFYIVVARLFSGRKKAAPPGEADKPQTAELDAAGRD
jgi:hypothetical protein